MWTSFDSHDVGGQAPLVARSLSVSANVYWGAEALFLGHGKQIVGPFANEKTKKKRKKEWSEGEQEVEKGA